MHIEIGEAKTLDCEDWKVHPDNRVTMHETIGGNVVQDFGHVKSGDKITCKCNVEKADKEIIFNYWENSILVNIVDEAGKVLENMRVIVNDYQYVKMFEKEETYTINFEFWRI